MFHPAARLRAIRGYGSVTMLYVRFAWISRFLISLGLLGLLTGGLLVLAAGTASAQDRRQNAPGEIDFYVLSLSWSPSSCEEAAERATEGRGQVQGRLPPC